MRSLLTTLLMAAILLNLVIAAVSGNAHDVEQFSSKTYSTPTYAPSFLR